MLRLGALIGSVLVIVAAVVTLSSRAEFAVIVVALPALGMNPSVRPLIPLLPDPTAVQFGGTQV